MGSDTAIRSYDKNETETCERSLPRTIVKDGDHKFDNSYVSLSVMESNTSETYDNDSSLLRRPPRQPRRVSPRKSTNSTEDVAKLGNKSTDTFLMMIFLMKMSFSIQQTMMISKKLTKMMTTV